MTKGERCGNLTKLSVRAALIGSEIVTTKNVKKKKKVVDKIADI